MRKTRNAADRFWEKVDRRGPSDCWEWQGATANRGYGAFRYQGRTQGAHRAAWELANGPIPNGLWVLHRCDNPPCVNPAHLWLGTRTDNLRDMAAKGRQVFQAHPERYPHGARHGMSKLTEKQVRLIRTSKAPARLLAERYGVGVWCIYDVKTGRTWAHVK